MKFLRRLALVWMVSAAAFAFDNFTIADIRVEGLKRLELGTVLTYLPFSTGDQLNEQTARQGIRALYDTGLFQDVGFSRDGEVLVVRVVERPAIASFKIEGNKKLGGDEIKKGLAKAGLAEGELYRKDLLDQVEQELKRQYYANGYYAVRIKTDVIKEAEAQVRIEIKVTEGPVAKIKKINVVGNQVFDDEALLEGFELQPTRTISLFQSSNNYSKEKLVGDLESLSSHYQDRGYLRFEVSSVQVALSPDKRDIFITINLEEGAVYKVKDFRLTGELILSEDFLKQFISVKPGQIFSRKETTESGNRIAARLADEGYAFAKVDPAPRIDDSKKEVSLDFAVQPGRRVYVRQINFAGNSATDDETLRREMRQLEGATFSRAAVERSRERLQRLPFLEEVQVETDKVPGSEDLVDVDFDVKERAAGAIQIGVGFSDAAGFLINGSVTNSNFRGSGDRVSVTAENNEFARLFSASWTDPYATDDGISRTVNMFFRESEQVVRFSSGFDTNAFGAGLTYGLPLSEFASLRLGVGADRTVVSSFAGITSNEVLQFLLNNGTEFTNYELRTGLVRDTRDRTIFARRGMLDRLDFDITVPGSDLEFYRASFQHQQFFDLFKGFAYELRGNLGYADGYGDTDDIPPFENFFVGGADSVRGFREGTVGPRDTPFGNAFGGKLRVSLQNELIVPMPFLETDGKSTRLALFYDIGSAFRDTDEFETDLLRSSAGVAFQWFTPFFGLLRLSYAVPIDTQPEDEEDRFQISFGVGF
ncbi:MAG: outer membrane protein assembly factor BamA [Nevskiales bacterium]